MQLIDRFLKTLFGWMLVPDPKKLEKASAIYVPAVGVKKDEGRLVRVGEKCMSAAIDLYWRGVAPLLILSNAYLAFWEEEWELKLERTDAAEIPREALVSLRPDPTQRFTSSNSETKWLGEVIRERCLRNIVVVNEEWHMMRTLRMLERLYPGVKFQPLNVRGARLEAHKAFPRIKGYTTCEGLWQLENIILTFRLWLNRARGT